MTIAQSTGHITSAGNITLGGNGRLIVGSTGSLASTTIQRGADPNTGIYWPAADTLGFVTSGVERIRITSTGAVTLGDGSAQDISLIFDDGTDRKIYWDDSSSRFVITAPLDFLSTAPGMRFRDSDATGTPYSDILGNNGRIFIQADAGNETADTYIRLDIDGTQCARFDSASLILGHGVAEDISLIFDDGTDRKLFWDDSAGRFAFDHAVNIYQASDDVGFSIYGYDDKSTLYGTFSVDAAGNTNIRGKNNLNLYAVDNSVGLVAARNVYAKLGDAAGLRTFNVRDSDNNIVAQIRR